MGTCRDRLDARLCVLHYGNRHSFWSSTLQICKIGLDSLRRGSWYKIRKPRHFSVAIFFFHAIFFSPFLDIFLYFRICKPPLLYEKRNECQGFKYNFFMSKCEDILSFVWKTNGKLWFFSHILIIYLIFLHIFDIIDIRKFLHTEFLPQKCERMVHNAWIGKSNRFQLNRPLLLR